MMRNIRRRIEALESAWAAEHIRRQMIAKRALRWLQPAEIELLISVFGAEREDRDLSKDESAAKQSYARALSRVCCSAGYSSARGFEDELDFGFVIILLITLKIPDSAKLAMDVLIALEEGRTVSQDEAAAFEKYSAEWSRLYRLTGLPAAEETDGQEGGL